MKTFINRRKDSVDVWAHFDEDDDNAVTAYLQTCNGDATIRRADEFNPQWIDEEKHDREDEYVTSFSE